jgi:hypothetical protein
MRQEGARIILNYEDLQQREIERQARQIDILKLLVTNAGNMLFKEMDTASKARLKHLEEKKAMREQLAKMVSTCAKKLVEERELNQLLKQKVQELESLVDHFLSFFIFTDAHYAFLPRSLRMHRSHCQEQVL